MASYCSIGKRICLQSVAGAGVGLTIGLTATGLTGRLANEALEGQHCGDNQADLEKRVADTLAQTVVYCATITGFGVGFAIGVFREIIDGVNPKKRRRVRKSSFWQREGRTDER